MQSNIYGLPAYCLEAEPKFDIENKTWHFVCAIPECPAYKYVLPGYLFDELFKYKLQISFKTRKKAIKALRKAILRHVKKEIKQCLY